MTIAEYGSQEQTSYSTDTTLRKLSNAANLPIGVAVDAELLKYDTEYAQTIATHFNMCVAENQFKPAWVWKGPDSYDFEHTDRLASFARQHDMLLRGHTLLWHESVPTWLQNGEYNSSEVATMLRSYIHTIAGRYRGQITQWDVVNEAISDEPGNNLRDTFWLRTLGPDYIYKTFEWAREADPDASLYYNDYEAEAGPKSDAVFKLVSDLHKSGAPIHGVGMQCHFVNGWEINHGMMNNVQRIEALGLTWQATETDVRIRLDGHPPTQDQLEVQAMAYRDLTNLCLTSSCCAGLLFWGVSDRHSWIPGFRPGWGSPLLLDEKYHPKPAYRAVAQSLQSPVFSP